MLTAIASLLVATQLQGPPVEQVWRDAADRGFHGGAIVVSGSETKLMAVNSTSKARMFALKPDSRFPICSVTKAMTAFLVLQLVEENTLSLETKVRDVWSEEPNFAGGISVRQLLTHTSGLRNMDLDPTIYRSADKTIIKLTERLGRVLGTELSKPEGTNYDYNNADFLVLQQIIEKKTGKSYERLLKDRVLAPAGMKQTSMASWGLTSKVVPCFEVKDGNESGLPPFNHAIYGAAGGLLSTASDLQLWMMFMLTNPTGRRVLTSGSQFGGFQGFGGYAYQSDFAFKKLGKSGDEVVFERPGAINGYILQVTFLPERNLAVATYTNRNGTDLGSLFQGTGLTADLLGACLP